MGKNLKKCLILILILLPVAVGISAILSRGYGMLINMEQEGIIISSVLGICSYVLFIKTLINPYNTDRTKAAYIYLVLSAFVIPAIIVYGYNSHKGILYYIFSAVVFVTLPVIPYAIAQCIKEFIEKYFPDKKHKTLVTVLIGIIINLGLSAFGNWHGTWITISRSPLVQLEEKFSIGGNNISDILSWIFPMNSYGIMSLLNGNTVKSILYFSIYVVLVLLFIGMVRVSTKRS